MARNFSDQVFWGFGSIDSNEGFSVTIFEGENLDENWPKFELNLSKTMKICKQQLFMRQPISQLEAVIVVGNGIGDPTSNLGRSYLHFFSRSCPY